MGELTARFGLAAEILLAYCEFGVVGGKVIGQKSANTHPASSCSGTGKEKGERYRAKQSDNESVLQASFVLSAFFHSILSSGRRGIGSGDH
jgi:hypothetical protein